MFAISFREGNIFFRVYLYITLGGKAPSKKRRRISDKYILEEKNQMVVICAG